MWEHTVLPVMWQWCLSRLYLSEADVSLIRVVSYLLLLCSVRIGYRVGITA